MHDDNNIKTSLKNESMETLSFFKLTSVRIEEYQKTLRAGDMNSRNGST